MEKINGQDKKIRDLLANSRYSLDFYQREYKWQFKHLQDLINDLSEAFLESYNEKHSRAIIENYGTYFLGSIIINDKDGKGKKFIIDGQQRLTTITLLIIFLIHKINDEKQKAKLMNLVYSDVFGKESFNIDVEERKKCMTFLLDNGSYEDIKINESVQNIVDRYKEINELFPDEFTEKAFLFFSDWLIQNVYLIVITTNNDEDAYTIFETMNDRGLSLSPSDMLKGYLITNITDEENRKEAVQIWNKNSEDLRRIEDNGIEEGIKSWLRSQYAVSIRERIKGATPQDFDKIGTEFHRWIKDNGKLINLQQSDDFYNFTTKTMTYYLNKFVLIKKSSIAFDKKLKYIFYNSKLKFTLQYPVLLSPIILEDEEDTILKKLNLVSIYLDITLARRIWNFRSFSYSDMQFSMYNLIKEIRNKNLTSLHEILYKKLNDDQNKFIENPTFYLHQGNRFYIHNLLARITEFIEESSGINSRFIEYTSSGINKYEVEHIWAKHFERHLKEFNNESDFERYRNYIGGLLLLPKKFNASYGDLPYEEKLKHYYNQNLLASSLNPNCYNHNPGFLSFIKLNNLHFKSYTEFNKETLEERQELYLKLAELIWSPENLKKYA